MYKVILFFRKILGKLALFTKKSTITFNLFIIKLYVTYLQVYNPAELVIFGLSKTLHIIQLIFKKNFFMNFGFFLLWNTTDLPFYRIPLKKRDQNDYYCNEICYAWVTLTHIHTRLGNNHTHAWVTITHTYTHTHTRLGNTHIDYILNIISLHATSKFFSIRNNLLCKIFKCEALYSPYNKMTFYHTYDQW